MCCEKPSIRPLYSTAHTQVYAYGGRGNARLINFSCGDDRTVSLEVISKVDSSINLAKAYNQNNSLLSKPMTVGRKGKIIRRIQII